MADTLLLTIPNQLGVDYNAHVLEHLRHVAPELWLLTANPVDATLRLDRPLLRRDGVACVV